MAYPVKRRALSLVEIVIGALILGFSGVAVMELVRTNTVGLQVTEIEAVARGLAADVLERYAAAPRVLADRLGAGAKDLQGVPLLWRDVLEHDAGLRYGFPQGALEKLLDTYVVRITLRLTPNYDHASFDPDRTMKALEVTVQWSEPIAPERGGPREPRTVTYATLLER
jgi:hypothetical protein